MPLATLLTMSFHDACWNLGMAALFTLFGLLTFWAAYFIIEKAAPFDVRKELVEDNNVAVGVMLGGMFIGIGLIIAAAISG